MALQVSWLATNANTKQAAPEAYVKAILSLTNEADGAGVAKANKLTVKVFASQAARDSHAYCIYQTLFAVPADTVNSTPAAYAWLKTPPQFHDAIDLL